MTYIELKCPQCNQNEVIKFGRKASGNQSYRCKNTRCDKDTFLRHYCRPGDLAETKEKISAGSGMRLITSLMKF
ncbi:IS1/IS1595 family N-terminal zinc-binding domain-containing protein [Piscirickettsia salmonis]|uniref:IS1/IS1595 family N-terminal zinc-binding domain-containing protein n=1 Tax=Piscirickettsia salmonis TaxID=1238 RepID=UPI0007C8B35D|nr:hypothetical protein A0O36_01791 [Piscirickettsiaceae bacterium NZ-RLO1]